MQMNRFFLRCCLGWCWANEKPQQGMSMKHCTKPKQRNLVTHIEYHILWLWLRCYFVVSCDVNGSITGKISKNNIWISFHSRLSMMLSCCFASPSMHVLIAYAIDVFLDIFVLIFSQFFVVWLFIRFTSSLAQPLP